MFNYSDDVPADKRGTNRPPRPIGPAPMATNIPAEIKFLPQWVAWRYAWAKGKWTKQPLDIDTGALASTQDPTEWHEFDDVLAYYRAHRGVVDGVGLVFTKDDDYTGVDLDDCRDPETGVIAGWAQDIIDSLGSYAEVSPSLTGVKIIVRGRLPWTERSGRKHVRGKGPSAEGGAIEIYHFGRYFTLTGQRLDDVPTTIEPAQEALDDLCGTLFPDSDTVLPDTVLPDTAGARLTDEEVLAKCRRYKNGDKFSRLWGGDRSDYANDCNLADLALCGMLAFFTGPDPDRIDRLFRLSGLMRPKWDEKRDLRSGEKSTWGGRTIELVLMNKEDYWNPTTEESDKTTDSRTQDDRGEGRAHSEDEEPESRLGSIDDWTDGDRMRLPSGAVLVRLSSVPRRKLEWLWDGRIPVGKLTLIAGDPGDGKSYMTLDLASRISNGVPLPGQSSAALPGYTLVMAAEDDPEDTIGPRIDALGADDDKIILFGGVGYGDGLLRLDRDMKQLEEALAFTKARMVIIDPINAYMGDTNGNQDISVRAVLGPLSHLAARYGAAVIAVMHTGKGEASTPIHKILGSIAYVGTARSVLAVGRDPDDADRRIVLQIKSNVAGRVPGLAYRIVDEKICWDEEPVDITAEQLFRMGGSGPSKVGSNDGPKMTKVQIAEEFLREALKNGPRHSDELFEQAKGQGISRDTMYRAKRDMGIAATNAGPGQPWFWYLPSPDQT